MVELIQFKDQYYPKYEAEGFASRFIFPFATIVCQGTGYDVGCGKKEWALPNSIPIDLSFPGGWHALNLPQDNVDYIFSSHCLEHLDNWVDVLNYWTKILRIGGILFLYLPHYDQEYWRPWNDRQHIHALSPEILSDYMKQHYKNVFKSGCDLFHSFAIFGEKI